MSQLYKEATAPFIRCIGCIINIKLHLTKPGSYNYESETVSTNDSSQNYNAFV